MRTSELPSAMNQYDRLLDLMSGLKAAHIHFTVGSVREEANMLHVAVPGERWEIELLRSGEMEIEEFKSDGIIYNEAALSDLFQRFKD